MLALQMAISHLRLGKWYWKDKHAISSPREFSSETAMRRLRTLQVTSSLRAVEQTWYSDI